MSEYYKILEGKKINAIGDSYLDGDKLGREHTWITLLSQKYNIELNNFGKNGSTMSNFVTTNKPMVERYADMPDNNPDLVFIEGGRNDYNKQVPIGTFEDTETTTMMGAARFLIEKLREKYPNARFLCMTCWEVGGNPNSEGNMCSDYGKALLEVCEKLNVTCINAMDQKSVGVYMTDPDFRLAYCQHANDISHLNAEGMKMVLPVFEKIFAEQFTK